MRIAAPSEKVYSLIKITQLDRVLPVCDTVDEAFAGIKKRIRIVLLEGRTLDYIIIVALSLSALRFSELFPAVNKNP